MLRKTDKTYIENKEAITNSRVQERAEHRPRHAEERWRVAVVDRTDPDGERSLDGFHHHLIAFRIDLFQNDVSETGRTLPQPLYY